MKKLFSLISIAFIGALAYGAIEPIENPTGSGGSLKPSSLSVSGDSTLSQATFTGTVTVQGSAFSVGGSTLVVSGGRVGVNQATPQSLLHINSTTPGASTPTARGDIILESIGNASTVKGGLEWMHSTSGGGYGSRIHSYNNAHDDFALSTRFNSPTWTDRLLIQGDTGNVGIGTASPENTLTVNGIVASSNTASQFILASPSVNHGMTSQAPTSAYGKMTLNDASAGGLGVMGYTSGGANSLNLTGQLGANSVLYPAVNVTGWVKSGASAGNPSATTPVFSVNAGSVSGLRVEGDGKTVFMHTSLYASTMSATGGLALAGPISAKGSDTLGSEGYILKVSSANADIIFYVKNDGHVGTGGNVPNIGTCANGAFLATSADTAGKIQFTGANTSCSITWAVPRIATPICVCTGATGAGEGCQVSAESTTGLTLIPLTGAWDNGDAINYICLGLQ